MFNMNRAAIFKAQEIFKQNLKRERQGREITDFGLCVFQREVIVGFPVDCQCFTGLKRIVASACHSGTSKDMNVVCSALKINKVPDMVRVPHLLPNLIKKRKDYEWISSKKDRGFVPKV